MNEQSYDGILTDEDFAAIINNEPLEQMHIAAFHSVFERRTNCSFQGARSWMDPQCITPVRKDLDYIQIIYLPGHYVCCYYDTSNIFIYDSLGGKRVTPEMKIFLERLFPDQDLTQVKFPVVQRQPNFVDCAVYAIAFAVSLVFGLKPNNVRYDHESMRTHLIKMLTTSVIEHFPQNPTSRHHQNCVLPLNIALDKRQKKIADKLRNKAKSKIENISQKKQIDQHSPDIFQRSNLISTGLDNLEFGNTMQLSSPIESRTSKLESAVLERSSNEYLPGNDANFQIVKNKKRKSEKMNNLQCDKKSRNDSISISTNNIYTVLTVDDSNCENEKLETLEIKHEPNEKEKTQTTEKCSDLIPDHEKGTDIVECAEFSSNIVNHNRNNRRQLTWQGRPKIRLQYLKESEELLIRQNNWIGTDHMTVFTSMVQNFTNFLPYDPSVIQNLNLIKPVPENLKHIQILHGSSHWICTYYDENVLHIYDSLNSRLLTNNHIKVVEKLYPGLDKNLIIFHQVQHQPNNFDCGVFAIAFATSIICGVDPVTTTYDHKLMRNHLITMLKNSSIEHFPTVENNDLPHLQSEIIRESSKKDSNTSCKIELPEDLNLEFSDFSNDTDSESSEIFITKKKRKKLQKNKICKKSKISDKNLSLKEKKTKAEIFAARRYRLLSTFKIRKRSEKFIQSMSDKLALKYPEKNNRVEAERIFKWCLVSRKNSYCRARRTFKSLQDIAEANTTKMQMCDSDIDDAIVALCGESKHRSTTEPYFSETSYNLDQFSIPNEQAKNKILALKKLKESGQIGNILHAETLIQNDTVNADNVDQLPIPNKKADMKILTVNESGQICNIFPAETVIQKKSKKKSITWKCDKSICKIYKDMDLINHFNEFLKHILKIPFNSIRQFSNNLKSCNVPHYQHSKRGHPESCYRDYKSCQSKFISTLILAPHFPQVRYIKTKVEKILYDINKVDHIDTALNDTDIESLNTECEFIKENLKNTTHDDLKIDLNEDNIIASHADAFEALHKKTLDTPSYSCVSCEKLFSKKNVMNINNFRKPLETRSWLDLMKYIRSSALECDYVCTYCLQRFRNNQIPVACILNNLITYEQPKEITVLNDFEKCLIQRAKPFQVVQRMGTVMNKNLPHKRLIPKVKGRTFYLPLPLEETLKKICPDDQPINLNHEFFILVRGLPNKSKIIWENLVDMKKVLNALKWLKSHNPLYKDIILPESETDLLENLKQTELVFEDPFEEDEDEETKKSEDDERETENEINKVETDEKLETPKETLAVCKEMDLGISNRSDIKKPMLTQMSQSNDFYDQYTVYPINEMRIKETDTNLYQMLKIEDKPFDNRFKSLDLLCFPELFPNGINGQHEDRQSKISDSAFIKAKLLSKHSQFRLSIPFIFHALNDSTMRSLKSGIYQKLNITNPLTHYTASTYLDALKKEQLETNLNTIFSKLRNTEQFWKTPRNDLNCMIDHYGPATWFLTLSPAEWLWTDLFEYIREINKPKFDNVPVEELIALDPVSVCRFMNNKFHALLDFILSDAKPLGEIIHYFFRLEYQGRGTQHFHLLLWVKNAPILGESPSDDVAEFILKYVTCRIPNKTVSPILYERVNTHQRHKHNSYCLRSKKGKGRFCRFGFSRPVTNKLILRDTATSIASRRTGQKMRLYDLPRSENEENINDYCPVILTAWEGNMDIQFCGEVSTAISRYITKYQTKPEKSNIDQNVLKENTDETSVCSRLWNFALRSLTNRECGVLEAVDTLLGISLFGTDSKTSVQWINVNEIRNKKLKMYKEIQLLEKDSEEIFCPNMVDDYYPRRPSELETWCLYDFIRWFEYTKDKPCNANHEYYCIGKIYIKKRKYAKLINHYKYKVEIQPEKFYHSILFLFKPWRKLEDLKDGHSSYVEAFNTCKGDLSKLLQYHDKLIEYQNAFDEIDVLIKDKLEKFENENNDFEELECQPIGADIAMKDFKDIDDNIDTAKLSQITDELNADQKRIFDKITVRVNSGQVLRLFVTGEGGTGKSHLIQAVRCWMKSNMNKKVVVVGPTGVSALTAKGVTMHKLFLLPVDHKKTPKYKKLSDMALKILREELASAGLIIIDEVSMVSNVMLMYICLRLMEIFNTMDIEDGWFGKQHIILFGDLMQLPPVRDNPAFKKLTTEEMKKYLGSFGNHNLWANLFEYDELTINMRQINDLTYAQMLSRLRIGVLTSSDRAELNKRLIPFKSKHYTEILSELCNYIDTLPSDTICLLPTRHMCEVLNDEMLSRIKSDELHLTAQDTLDCSPYIRNKVEKALSKDDEDDSQTGGLSKVITVKIGAKIMITRNIDISRGLVNGTIGILKSVKKNLHDMNDIEEIHFSTSPNITHKIEKINVKFEVIDRAFVNRKQFPIRTSYAITVHKSQGLSLKTAVVDAGTQMFANGQVYVALSRITSIEGLHLINFDPASIKASSEAISEYNRLKKKYRPELPAVEIKPCNDAHKIHDRQWVLSKNILNCQNNEETLVMHSDTEIRGLSNPDKMSCYVNSVLQCLFQNNFIKDSLLKLPKQHVMRICIDSYLEKNKKVDIMSIKRYVHERYTLHQQEDAAQFAIDLIQNLDRVHESIKFKKKYSSICLNKQCAYVYKQEIENTVLVIPIASIKDRKSVILQDLININKNTKSPITGKCPNCSNTNLLHKTESHTFGRFILLKLDIFKPQQVNKISYKYNIKSASTDTIKVENSDYTVTSAILHDGLTMNEGHYKSYIKKGKIWYEADDLSIRKKQWPRNSKEVYLFLLEKK